MRRGITEGRPPVITPVGISGLVLGIAAGFLFQLFRMRPLLTERFYTAGPYVPVVDTLAALSAIVPFSLAEFSFGLVVLLLLLAPVRGWRRIRFHYGSRVRAAIGAVLTLAGTFGWAWAIFLALWGFNYARPLAWRLFDLPRSTDKAAADEIVARLPGVLDSLRGRLEEDERGVVKEPADLAELDRHLAPLQSEVLAEAGLPRVRGGRTKSFLVSPLLLRWGVSGVYGPFTGEPNVVLPAAPGGLPFTVAHERAHLQGFAWEEDASFVALLTLWRSDRPEVRYAGWLELWLELRRPPKDLSPAVQRDIAAIASFYREHVGREAPALNRAYSAYLKAHGVKGGVKSYARVADLALRWLEKHGVPEPP